MNIHLGIEEKITLPSFMKAETEAGELHLEHTSSKEVEYAFAATKTPSTWAHEHNS
jgi:hypothetical protein